MTLAVAPVSLPDVAVSRVDIASVRGRLRSHRARYAPFFGRRELRGADANAVRTQQLFLRKARWDGAPGAGGGDPG